MLLHRTARDGHFVRLVMTTSLQKTHCQQGVTNLFLVL